MHVHGADIQDRDGGNGVLARSRKRYPFVQRAYADGGYAGRLVEWAKTKTHIVLEIVRRNATAKGFEVLPRRWVVERTFAWIIKNRRFAATTNSSPRSPKPSSSSPPAPHSSGDGREGKQPSQTCSKIWELVRAETSGLGGRTPHICLSARSGNLIHSFFCDG